MHSPATPAAAAPNKDKGDIFLTLVSPRIARILFVSDPCVAIAKTAQLVDLLAAFAISSKSEAYSGAFANSRRTCWSAACSASLRSFLRHSQASGLKIIRASTAVAHI